MICLLYEQLKLMKECAWYGLPLLPVDEGGLEELVGKEDGAPPWVPDIVAQPPDKTGEYHTVLIRGLYIGKYFPLWGGGNISRCHLGGKL
jgi:hypothetical protein